MRKNSVSTMALMVLGVAVVPGHVFAADQTKNVFNLGEMTILGARPDMAGIDISTLDSAEMMKFNRIILDDALKLIPGTSSSNSGGSRNERLINVRGFDRFQVPLMIDGIRLYMPYDNRLDFGRFLTSDLSEIQVVKGYVSVIDGPGALGGAINLVTRKPERALEAEARVGISLDRDVNYGGFNSYASVGTRQEKYYLQGSGSITKRDHWGLSGKFVPTANQASGDRDHSNTRDWKVNVKAGFTPYDDDEYSLSFTKQSGSKDAPHHVTDAVNSQRNWRWPYWDVTSLYWLSQTQLGEAFNLKSRLYYNQLENSIRAFDNKNYDTQTLTKAFNSPYRDKAWGGSLELDMSALENNLLKGAFHYRRDKHVERQTIFPSGFTEPDQVTIEDTYSIALENTYHPIASVDVVVGVSYDWRDLRRAEDWAGDASGNFVYYELKNSHAWNGQGAIVYHHNDSAKVYASVSSRSRFPTIFERYSSRFGGATSNPNLKPERAINFEIGAADRLADKVDLSGALFYSDLKDAIQSVPVVYNGQNVTQNQNLGDGTYYGFELAVKAAVADNFDFGGNYTYTHRKLHNPSIAAFRPLDVPDHKAFVYADYRPLAGLSLTPSVELASSRWTVTTGGGLYYKTGAYVLANLNAQYQVTDNLELAAGVRNLFDRNYQLADGFPEEGRNIFLNLRIRY
ncbi:TonB-dependent receptor plug domain-containing protein [Govanella unica]|uniref:TonB-dependent receptor n=1 Tax=Govanella unica TaxID=2975056 RepID=A0A9X3Z6Z5_9PROT|nr:TonB-dependent receptor [Govania unica]MDA5193444.1 TonB-dependent receptor [Govania unica]